jgi:hypothetical protein
MLDYRSVLISNKFMPLISMYLVEFKSDVVGFALNILRVLEFYVFDLFW